ncbi:MAG: Gfo/Idh/MocA family oxidoreductase [Dehalococcoidia bacterium]|nr:Gfo/Idh/MocA family oxidoreductase [Dehalococcoidia bacterium]
MSGLRVGVVGLGFGATVHVPAFLSEGWTVPVVWSRRIDRAREQAAAFAIADATDDIAALIARDDIDAVAIATPPVAHYEMVMAALAAGKHVLCEKPFARNAAEAFEMYDAARSAGLTGMLAHEFRFAPQRLHIKQLLAERYIGTPQIAQIELFTGGRRLPQQPPNLGASVADGGGMLGGLGSHFIDGLRDWFGEVREVSGLVRVLRPDRTDPHTGAVVQTDAEDTLQFALTFENGVVVSMTASGAMGPGLGGRTFISGTEGSLFAVQRGWNPEPDGVVLAAKVGEREFSALPMPEAHRPFEDDRDARLVAFRLMVREFERGIREGTSPAPSFEDGWRCQQVMDAVRESSATGRRVRIE